MRVFLYENVQPTCSCKELNQKILNIFIDALEKFLENLQTKGLKFPKIDLKAVGKSLGC